jgi:ParB family chromosome partitioning protein
MSDVLSQVSAQAAQEVDTADIADSAVADRFDVTDALRDLTASIAASGQQLPVLLRFRRGAGPRYEVVYGRRRIAACRALGIKVKAFIKEMDHREALVSQALENSARLERSFIEQAIFARNLEAEGFNRKEIAEVLATDKGTLSKLIGVAEDVPDAVIYGIGAAHEAGRRPWLELRRLINRAEAPSGAALLALVPKSGSPEERLAALIAALDRPVAPPEPAPAPAPAALPAVEGAPLACRIRGKRLILELAKESDRAFLDHLEGQLAALYSDWEKGQS